MLERRRLTLVNTDSWEDRNDACYMTEHIKKRRLKSIMALCFTKGPETFHHWKVYAGNPGGVCVYFDEAGLRGDLSREEGVTMHNVLYLSTKECRRANPGPEMLPFLKRRHFSDEREYRVVYVSDRRAKVKVFRLRPEVILRVVLSP